MTRRLTIGRGELKRVVSEACRVDMADSTRTKLRAVAETTPAVAFGWFHCDGVNCPTRHARRHNQSFQQAYDYAMADLFGVERERPFAVDVEDSP